MKIARKNTFTVKVVELENGESYGTTYDQEGNPLINAEGNNPYQVMLAIADKMYNANDPCLICGESYRANGLVVCDSCDQGGR